MRKSKETTKKAILIEKHANNKKSDQQAIKSMLRMRYAINNSKPAKNRYYLEFMTEKGRMKFQVESKHYNTIKINSLGDLTYDKKEFKSFVFNKIATKNDVEKLGW